MDLAFLEETKFCLPARRSCRNPSPAFPSPCPTLPALFGTWWRNPSPSPWGGYAPSPLPLPAAASPCAISMPSPFLCRQSPYTALGVDVVQSQEQGPPDGGPCRVRCLFLGLVRVGHIALSLQLGDAVLVLLNVDLGGGDALTQGHVGRLRGHAPLGIV